MLWHLNLVQTFEHSAEGAEGSDFTSHMHQIHPQKRCYAFCVKKPKGRGFRSSVASQGG